MPETASHTEFKYFVGQVGLLLASPATCITSLYFLYSRMHNINFANPVTCLPFIKSHQPRPLQRSFLCYVPFLFFLAKLYPQFPSKCCVENAFSMHTGTHTTHTAHTERPDTCTSELSFNPASLPTTQPPSGSTACQAISTRLPAKPRHADRSLCHSVRNRWGLALKVVNQF